MALLYVLVFDSAIVAECNPPLVDTTTNISQLKEMPDLIPFLKSLESDNYAHNINSDLSGETDGGEVFLTSKSKRYHLNSNLDRYGRADKNAQALDFYELPYQPPIS